MKRYVPHILPSDAYWISPSGEIKLIKTTHIDDVINNPKSFGYSSSQIEDIYNKHNEYLGVEGKAREEIIKDLLKKGWVRIRYHKRNDSWSVNALKLSKRVKDYLFQWAENMLEKGYSKFSEVILDLINSRKKYNLKQLSNDILFNESVKYHLKFVENYSENKEI
jgi:hypothetical protein